MRMYIYCRDGETKEHDRCLIVGKTLNNEVATITLHYSSLIEAKIQ